MSKAELAYYRGQLTTAIDDGKNELDRVNVVFARLERNTDHIDPQAALEHCTDCMARGLEFAEQLRLVARCATNLQCCIERDADEQAQQPAQPPTSKP